MAHWYDTPEHSWLVLTPEENAQVPAPFRMADYEEDAAWSIAVVAVPSLLNGPAFKHLDTPEKRARLLERARAICCNYYPEAYAAITGEQPTPENSVVLAESKFAADHANHWVVISAVGDWCASVPQGYVLGTATRGGQREPCLERRDYLIRVDKYDARGPFWYVIQPDDVLQNVNAGV